ncbi:MAG: hypothetical protein ACTSO9_09360 [Candidatus Helarchaeota archaeon]
MRVNIPKVKDTGFFKAWTIIESPMTALLLFLQYFDFFMPSEVVILAYNFNGTETLVAIFVNLC